MGGKRSAYFCILIFTNCGGEKIHSVIKNAPINNHGLRWLRVRISYHQFPNLGEILTR